jgi:hypothetical protein
MREAQERLLLIRRHQLWNSSDSLIPASNLMFHPVIDVTNNPPLTRFSTLFKVEKEYDDADDVEGKVHGR